MRAIKRKRPRRRQRLEAAPSVNLPMLARSMHYIGSVEHKDAPTPAGWPRPRADANLCDRALGSRFPQMTRWLRQAVAKGDIGAPWEGSYPRYAWYKDRDTVYEARLVNQTLGEYKGYPLNEDEWPEFLK